MVKESENGEEMINLEEEPEMMGDGAAAPEMDPYNPKFATTNDMENQIL